MPDERIDTPNPALEDDPNPIPTIMVGIIGVIVTVAIVLALDGLFHRVARSEAVAKSERGGLAAVRDVRDEQARRLAEYRWIDREAGVVGIPIERAMELVVQESGRRPATVSGAAE